MHDRANFVLHIAKTKAACCCTPAMAKLYSGTSYIQAQAIFKTHRIQKAIQQGKKPLIQSRGAEIAVILFMLMIFILMYSVLVPNPSARRGQFFIQRWWPINAGFIGLLYYINFWLYLRLFAVNDIEKQYTLLQRRKSG